MSFPRMPFKLNSTGYGAVECVRTLATSMTSIGLDVSKPSGSCSLSDDGSSSHKTGSFMSAELGFHVYGIFTLNLTRLDESFKMDVSGVYCLASDTLSKFSCSC